jgi:EpsI family protein
MRQRIYFTIALVLMVVTALAMYAPIPVKAHRPRTPLDFLPVTVGEWVGANGAPSDAMPLDPNVEEQLLRTYQRGADVVWLSVGYYSRQREGRRHRAMDLLYPGQGWNNIENRALRLSLDSQGNTATINAIIMQRPTRQVVTIYWYQMQSQILSSEFANRWMLLKNSLLRQRSDGAFIRIVSPVNGDRDVSAVLATQVEFAKLFHPELSRRFSD